MTEQTQSGPQQSPIDKRYVEVQATISKYFEQTKLGNLVSMNEVEHYLTLNQTDRRKLLPKEAAEASLVLTQQAAYIQAEVNRQFAVSEWCVDQIDGIIGPKIHQYGSKWTTKEYKRKAAVIDSDAATKLEKIRLEALLRFNALNYLPSYLHKVAHSYETLARTFVGREIQ